MAVGCGDRASRRDTMFILKRDLPHPESLLYLDKGRDARNEYRQHRSRYSKRIGPKALEFALAEWHHDTEDHRSPHDAWLESLCIEEVAEPPTSQDRAIRIVLKLLGAYHEGHLRIAYEGITSYSLDLPSEGVHPPGGGV